MASEKDIIQNLPSRCSKIISDEQCRKLTGAVFVGLQKAFDAVDHSVILQKPPYYGINGTELSWVKSFLKIDTSLFNMAIRNLHAS